MRLLENLLWKTTFWAKREEVRGDCWKWHVEQLHDSLPNISRVIKARRMNWAEHVVRMGEKGVTYGVVVGRLDGKRTLGRPRRRCKDLLKFIFKKWYRRHGLD
jgi:hypothetical protein